MGNYARTLNMISHLEEQLSITEDPERSAELTQEIGECKGYLEELASMDGYSSYSEMQMEESAYEVNKGTL